MISFSKEKSICGFCWDFFFGGGEDNIATNKGHLRSLVLRFDDFYSFFKEMRT